MMTTRQSFDEMLDEHLCQLLGLFENGLFTLETASLAVTLAAATAAETVPFREAISASISAWVQCQQEVFTHRT
jgi:hypothetical protein